MNAPLRHFCRNRHCRQKLPSPVENEHHAFCTPGCHSSFYRSRCLVCEEPMRRKRDSQRFKSGHKTCAVEYRGFPHVFELPRRDPLPEAGFVNNPPRSADKMGVKFGLDGYPPTHHCLREWWWGDPGIGDLSLYNKDGLTLARIVLEDDGRYHLRSPVTRPRLSWTDLKEARHRAESVTLSVIALDAADPKLAARIKKDNSTPHPMGSPLNRESSRETAIPSDWKATGDGATMPDIPKFLRRAPKVAVS